MIVGQGPIGLSVGAGGGCLDIFTLLYLFSSLSPSVWEKARYRLKYCLKGPLNPKQPTNQLRNSSRQMFITSNIYKLYIQLCDLILKQNELATLDVRTGISPPKMAN